MNRHIQKVKNLKPAQNLDEVFANLSPMPLTDKDEFNAFYRGEVNNVRGEDKMARIRLGLMRSFNANYFKALLAGHPGVGKSTELTKLLFLIEDKFETIPFNVTSELDPINFRPFDVLLLIMIKVAEQTANKLKESNANETLPDSLLKDIWDWFSFEEDTKEELKRIAGSVEAGAGPKGDSIWAKAFGLFAHLKGEIKYTSDRKTKIVEYRFSRISSLIELANRLLDECNRLLLETLNKEWLIIGEDFDKPGIPPNKVEEFFITYSNIIKELRTHIIFTIPVTLVYSEQATKLPVAQDRSFVIPDTPVFDQYHSPHEEGRKAVKSVIEARLDPALFEPEQMGRLIVASGGNLRDLFSMISQSADNAILRSAKTISVADVTKSINTLRLEYKRRLGESPYDKKETTIKDKIDRLKQVYDNEQIASFTNDVMHSLLRSRAVQEFNGRGWFGVHPLVVDILKELNSLKAGISGGIPGGTE